MARPKKEKDGHIKAIAEVLYGLPRELREQVADGLQAAGRQEELSLLFPDRTSDLPGIGRAGKPAPVEYRVRGRRKRRIAKFCLGA